MESINEIIQGREVKNTTQMNAIQTNRDRQVDKKIDK